jgi:dTDP-4-dehydrorhamnose 3,5-epimerase
MEIIKTELEGLLIIKPDVFEDERGYFFESYNREKFRNAGIDMKFVQDNGACDARFGAGCCS